MNKDIIFFYGIKFHNYTFSRILSKMQYGGYLVAPAASSLSKILINRQYYNALRNSNISIFDSGFFCILFFLKKGIRVKKFSGYLFLKKFLKLNFLGKKILLIDPNKLESDINRKFLREKRINVYNYIAPIYKKNFKDAKLCEYIKRVKPDYILINIGGEKQEILAYEINKVFKKIPIFCTGAAIGFLTYGYHKKYQAPINDTIDKLYLGWAVRILFNPFQHWKRFIESIKLLRFFFKFPFI